jgi:antitoxin component of MazEF toxin-antitoxin module
METQIKAKQMGGSIGVIIPREIVDKEMIFADDILKIKIEKVSNLNFLWGKLKDIKKPISKIMEEIDEGEG